MRTTPSASYSITVRCQYRNRPGMLGRVASAIGKAGGDVGAIDIVQASRDTIVRDYTINAANAEHGDRIVAALGGIRGLEVVNVSDRTFLLHLGGKVEVSSRAPLKTRDDLSMAYTPGVARICSAIHHDPRNAFTLTIKGNCVAIVTDGSAVLGLGNIGPLAALPVMEGKAQIFKDFAGVNAFPICLDTQEPDQIVEAVERIAPAFGGINLEDIAAPACFEVEQQLAERLDVPVFHDDQHGTAVVVLAALMNALKIVRKRARDVRVVFSGAGASATACVKLLQLAGVRDFIMCDSRGSIFAGRRKGMNPAKQWIAEHTNPERRKGSLHAALEGADVFIGLSGPNIVRPSGVKKMARDPIVFAMANPVPEIMPEKAAPHARVMATGRSDYPNQINNALCFPGFFQGLLHVGARAVTDGMKLAAAKAIAGVVKRSQLHEDYILPSLFNEAVVPAVAAAVAGEAYKARVARRRSRRGRPPGSA
ncbi:MAG: malic enzyme-like NAD(P)-binding protein [Armatimonadota bacterium]